MTDIFNKAANRWKRLDLLWKLIMVNVAVFLVIRIIGIIDLITGAHVADTLLDWLVLPSNLTIFCHRPWTLLSYMFTHYDVMHILFNMLTLYWLGTLFMMRCTPRQLMGLYIIGGIFGGLAYLGMAQLFPALIGTLLGASAAVMAIVIATAMIMPDYEIGLLLIGMVKLKYIAIGAIVIFALGLAGNNAGGHVAHMGGMLAGLWYGIMFNKGRDLSAPLNHAIDWIVNIFKRKASGTEPRRKFRPKKVKKEKKTTTKADQQAEARANLDEILDKIRQSGYSSLTADEKRRLFETSRKV